MEIRFHLCRPPEQGLEPGVFEEYAYGAGQRRIRAGGHVEGEDFPALDQLVQGWKMLPDSAFFFRLPLGPLGRVLHRRCLGTENVSDVLHVEQRDRKLEIPSTHEVRSFGSSFIQSWSYQVFTLCQRASKRFGLV